jgi:DNA-binding MarR family transcriptional regulator
MIRGNGESSESLLRLLSQAVSCFRADIATHLETNPETGDKLRNLNGGQRRLLTLIPLEGARGTDLAERAEMTKQALGQLAASLEDVGLLRATADTADGRARIWSLTPAGTKAAQAARDTLHAVETRWRDQLGQRNFDRLTATLKDINNHRRHGRNDA